MPYIILVGRWLVVECSSHRAIRQEARPREFAKSAQCPDPSPLSDSKRPMAFESERGCAKTHRSHAGRKAQTQFLIFARRGSVRITSTLYGRPSVAAPCLRASWLESRRLRLARLILMPCLHPRPFFLEWRRLRDKNSLGLALHQEKNS